MAMIHRGLRRSLETVGAESSFAAGEVLVTETDSETGDAAGGSSGLTLERVIVLSFAGLACSPGGIIAARSGVELGGGELRLGFAAPWQIFQL
jgi:hypothetical protein